jgi:ribosomal-protein-alanine N-acetyltransferase
VKAVNVTIRAVRVEDVERIIEIERSWQHLSHWAEESYYRLVKDQGGLTVCWLAETEDFSGKAVIAGFVIFHLVAGNSEVYNLAVDRSYARTGVGTQLMTAVMKESLRRYATRLLLEVRKSNAGAIRFYEGLGFKPLGERKNYYSNPTEDAMVMERNLLEHI